VKPGQGQSGGKGQQSQQDQQGNKPQDSSQGPSKDEATAKGAGQAIAEPQSQNPKNGGRPDDGRKSNAAPELGKSKPRDYDTEKQNRGKENVERWGDLPEHTRRVFENTSTEDLPVQYRKWIREFYLRTMKPTTDNK
jgi:hypothetical protein